MKKKHDQAKNYFARARVAAENHGVDKLLQKIDAGLTQLG